MGNGRMAVWGRGRPPTRDAPTGGVGGRPKLDSRPRLHEGRLWQEWGPRGWRKGDATLVTVWHVRRVTGREEQGLV